MTPGLSGVIAVAIGSAVGGVLRLLLVSWTGLRLSTTFPVGVLLVNVLGSFLFGVAIRYGVSSNALSATTRLALTAGFCGGFTTFSAFSMDIVEALENGRTTMVTSYVLTSLILGVAALMAGMSLGRALGK